MEIAPHYVLLAKLEEEISYQRKVINSFLFLSETSSDLVSKSLDVLRRLVRGLRLITLVLAEFEALSDRYAKEQALLLVSESLYLSALLLPTIENYSPLFLESISVYDEPIVERIEAVSGFLENSLQDIEDLAVEEVIQTVEDIQKTLEYHILVGEKTLGRIS